MVATDVASRGIGMIQRCPFPTFPFLSYLYILPYRRRVIVGALLSPLNLYVIIQWFVQASYGPPAGKSWTVDAVCHDSLFVFHLWLVP
jgi:hypothetical protein